MQSSRHSSGTQSRVSLSKHKQEIEQWVEQGRSDEWIADALGTSRSSVQSFRSRHGILRRRSQSSPGEQEQSSTFSSEPASVYEGVLDQGEEGYGLWLDPAVADDPLFQAGFSGVSDIRVLIEPDRIVLEAAANGGASTESTTGHPSSNSTSNPGNGEGQQTTTAYGADPLPHMSASANGREPGRVKFFDASRGFGFLVRPDGEELFFHRSEIQNAEELEAGEYVVYEPGMSQRGPAAKKVATAG